MMKKTIKITVFILLMIVLIAKVSNWFFNFSEAIKNIIDIVMFCLIGFVYIFWSVYQPKMKYKGLLIVCGAVIILMNFIRSIVWIKIAGIVCILIPLILFQFQGNKEKG